MPEHDAAAVPFYVVARVTIRYGKILEFYEAMAGLVPIMLDAGWKLKDSYQTLVGNLHVVYDIWEVPSPDTVTTGLAVAQADPRFVEVAAKLAASVESETISITTRTPFSP